MIQLNVQDLARAASKSNASIYAIDPRGLMGLSDGSIELQSSDDPGARGLDERALQNESRLARESLQALAELTGGFAVVNTNRLANAFDRILDENSSYYLLAYYPPNAKRDGKYHNINVRVNAGSPRQLTSAISRLIEKQNPDLTYTFRELGEQVNVELTLDGDATLVLAAEVRNRKGFHHGLAFKMVTAIQRKSLTKAVQASSQPPKQL